jgi:rare lipoprotein A (peptidoglycan hydrolase)
MKSYLFPIYSALKLLLVLALLVLVSDHARAEMASIYGGRDGLCGRPTASGERLNCAEMTAAHRTLAFNTRVRVCHSGCVTVRINDRGPWVRGRHIDLSPAAARAIGLSQTGRVTMTVDTLSTTIAALVKRLRCRRCRSQSMEATRKPALWPLDRCASNDPHRTSSAITITAVFMTGRGLP